MKPRNMLLAFAATLLLTGALAGASETTPAGAPVAPAEADETLMTPVDEAAACSAGELDFLASGPSQQASGICGSCSQNPCQGGQINQICGFSRGRFLACEIPYAQSCSDGKPKCYCWGGPLP